VADARSLNLPRDAPLGERRAFPGPARELAEIGSRLVRQQVVELAEGFSGVGLIQA